MDNLIDDFKLLKITSHNKLKYIITIQKNVRKFLIIKKLKSLKDKISLDIINILLNNYINNYLFNEKINEQLTKKKIRHQNFPSEISENIVKFAIFKKYGIMPSWNTNVGDLVLLDKKIEVKGFMSSGPSSFGPKEQWDYIYFIDCRDFLNKNFKIYELKISNTNNIWQLLKINKTDTFIVQALNKRRPHISFCDIYEQLKKYFNLIFNDNISKLY